jgi:hypothetical protein
VTGLESNQVKACADHPTRDAVTRCASCRRHICEACWLRRVDGEPWCERCIFYLSSRGANEALGVGFFLISVAITWAGLRYELRTEGSVSHVFWSIFVVSSFAGSVLIGSRRPPVEERSVTLRGSHDLGSVRPRYRPHPYRSALRRAARIVAAPVSGSKMAMLVLVSMVTIGLALPGLLDLPRLVEFELVAGAFWLLWGMSGTLLLYRGFRVSDDHLLARPRPPWRSEGQRERSLTDGQRRWACQSGCVDPEAALLISLLLLALAAAWLVVEVLIPFLLFLVYAVVRSALAAVANDDHDCEGHLGRALAWGFAWSTVYSLPLVGILAMVRWFTR